MKQIDEKLVGGRKQIPACSDILREKFCKLSQFQETSVCVGRKVQFGKSGQPEELHPVRFKKCEIDAKQIQYPRVSANGCAPSSPVGGSARSGLFNHDRPQSSSSSRFTAGALGLFAFTQSRERPE